jgi:fructokinase
VLSLGIDLGGTKISLAVLDEGGAELYRDRQSTPRGEYLRILELIEAMVNQAEKRLGRIDSIGIGTPGSASLATGLMRNANSVWLNGMPFQGDIEAQLGREVAIANDANCFVLSETTDGAARGASVAFGVILGTGVGGGLVVEGRLLEGFNRIAGEWGHNPLPDPQGADRPEPPCYCGRTGCIETYLSGPGLQASYHRATGQSVAGEEIVARAARAERAAREVLDHYADQLAKSLGTVVNLFDPEVIVLGGGLSRIGALYETVPRIWGRYIFSDSVRTRLVPPVWGDDSGVRGAARLTHSKALSPKEPSPLGAAPRAGV